MPQFLWTKGRDKISPDGARGPKVLGGHEPGRGSEVEFSSFLNPELRRRSQGRVDLP